ncbi:MAG: hypothetical protein WAU63_03385 [Methylovirgula sp.]
MSPSALAIISPYEWEIKMKSSVKTSLIVSSAVLALATGGMTFASVADARDGGHGGRHVAGHFDGHHFGGGHFAGADYRHFGHYHHYGYGYGGYYGYPAYGYYGYPAYGYGYGPCGYYGCGYGFPGDIIGGILGAL